MWFNRTGQINEEMNDETKFKEGTKKLKTNSRLKF